MHRLTALALCALLVCGCARDPRELTLRLLPAEAIGCQPTIVHSIVLRPLGDSPSSERPSLRLDLSGISTIDTFPAATVSVAVLAQGEIEGSGGNTVPWTGGGIAVLAGVEATELSVPLLTLRRSCSQSDTAMSAFAGSATTTLPDGRLLIAGGERSLDTLRVVTLGLGERLATTLDLPGTRQRVGLTATSLGEDLVLLAGGGASLTADGRETFELVRIDEGRAENGALCVPRRDHGAARLPDGRVLLVGGRSDAGARADAELIEVTASTLSASANLTGGALAEARIGPEVLVLDDGTVLVLGGVDEAGEPITSVERFDPEAETFTRIDPGWPSRADAAYVSLRGARVARVGGREGMGWSRTIDVLLEQGGVRVSLPEALGTALEMPRAAGLVDGRLLVVGGVPTGFRAQVVDVGASRDELEAALAPIEISRGAEHLVRLIDGAVAQIDAGGLSLLRLDLASEFDDPAASIRPAQINQQHELSLDAAGRWRGDGDLFIAEVDGARFDLPSSRFAAVSVELESSGPLEVLLTPLNAAPLVVAVDRTARFESCEVPIDGVLRIERRDALLRLASGDASAQCEIARDRGRVGVAIRAARGSAVRRLSVVRL